MIINHTKVPTTLLFRRSGHICSAPKTILKLLDPGKALHARHSQVTEIITSLSTVMGDFHFSSLSYIFRKKKINLMAAKKESRIPENRAGHCPQSLQNVSCSNPPVRWAYVPNQNEWLEQNWPEGASRLLTWRLLMQYWCFERAARKRKRRGLTENICIQLGDIYVESEPREEYWWSMECECARYRTSINVWVRKKRLLRAKFG